MTQKSRLYLFKSDTRSVRWDLCVRLKLVYSLIHSCSQFWLTYCAKPMFNHANTLNRYLWLEKNKKLMKADWLLGDFLHVQDLRIFAEELPKQVKKAHVGQVCWDGCCIKSSQMKNNEGVRWPNVAPLIGLTAEWCYGLTTVVQTKGLLELWTDWTNMGKPCVAASLGKIKRTYPHKHFLPAVSTVEEG